MQSNKKQVKTKKMLTYDAIMISGKMSHNIQNIIFAFFESF